MNDKLQYQSIECSEAKPELYLPGRRVRGGALKLTIVGAKELESKRWLSVVQPSPYVKLRAGKFNHQTTTKNYGGTSPEWNEPFIITLTDEGLDGSDELIHFTVCDKSNTGDSVLGTAALSIHSFLSTAGTTIVDLIIPGKPSESHGSMQMH